jgi:hypothetical protein
MSIMPVAVAPPNALKFSRDSRGSTVVASCFLIFTNPTSDAKLPRWTVRPRAA